MASDNYNPYSYPYQQNATQQYTTYQTTHSGNTVQPNQRPYQQPSVGTSRAADYSSHPALSYTGHNEYSTGQEQSWNNTVNDSYGGNRGNANSAAEVLRNMSNTPYASTSATNGTQTGLAGANTASSYSARYAMNNPNSSQFQTQQAHDAHTSYGQSQPRTQNAQSKRSQAANRVPSPAVATVYPPKSAQSNQIRKQQGTAGISQRPYSGNTQQPIESSRSASIATSGIQQQYSRQLPSVEASRSVSAAPQYTSAGMQSIMSLTSVAQAPTTSASAAFSDQSSNTVDPLAVYDPWPEYERKREALRAQRAMEDANAEAERVEAARRKAEEERLAEEQREKEAVEQAKSNSREPHDSVDAQHEQPVPSSNTPEPANAPGNALEAEIRAMMAKMRELNGRDPALLARIWEEERRSRANPSPTTSTKAIPQPSPVEPSLTATSSAPSVSNKKSKQPRPKNKGPAPVPMPEASAHPPVQVPTPAPPPQAAPPSSKGKTIWPAEKLTQLASTATVYLNNMNPDRHTTSTEILHVLHGNPSYVELCEHLERNGFKLNRATFAKELLSAVPDINSGTRKTAPRPAPPMQSAPVPAAVLKRTPASFAATNPRIPPAAAITADSPYPAFPTHDATIRTPALVAEMVPIKPERRVPANKEEAARKRKLTDLVDMTLLSDDEASVPQPKRLNIGTHHYQAEEVMDLDVPPIVNNFPTAAITSHPTREAAPQPAATQNLRGVVVAQNLDKRDALRRNSYNPATIARDVLLACGRHPSERQLNQHLEVLKQNLSVGFDSDLSTIRWDLIDPGEPPAGYYKQSVQAPAEDADDEEDSDGEGELARRRQSSSMLGGEGGARAQALPAAINPFHKQKRRGRPRASLPNPTSLNTPRASPGPNMSASAPRPAARSGGVGYSAFKSATAVGPDGQPLPKKKGRPVGWRKAIHGSAAIQSTQSPTPAQSSARPNVANNAQTPIHIDSRSPSVSSRVVHYQSYKCKWRGCPADLHNLPTLNKHIFKVHGKRNEKGCIECWWPDCYWMTIRRDPITNIRKRQRVTPEFDDEEEWRMHIQMDHLRSMGWRLGDGPAGGVSDSHDSEAYLSDAQGRRVTPRITADAEPSSPGLATPRGRGRPPKNRSEQDALDAHERFVSQKRRIGGPGMDRGGATLVNDKRRRGFLDADEAEEELVDIED